MNAYFDYIYLGGEKHTIKMCVVITDESDSLFYEETKEVKGLGLQTKYNLDYTLMAFNFACDVIKANDIEEVCFNNQNGLVFDWIIQKEDKNRPILNKVREKLIKLVNEDEYTLTFSKIVSANNKAKKLLAKEKKKKNTKAAKGSFDALLRDYSALKKEEQVSVKKAAKAPYNKYNNMYKGTNKKED